MGALTAKISLIMLILASTVPVMLISAQFEESGMIIRIDLFQNGTARWMFMRTISLPDIDDVEAFNLYMKEQAKNISALIDQFASSIIPIVNGASIMTGRSMRAYDFNVSFSLGKTFTGGDIGLIIYTFKWEGFAVKTEDKLFIGDVFEGGFYLFDKDKLSINFPDSYYISSISPQPDQTIANAVVWFGKRMFESRKPYIELTSKLINLSIYISKYKVYVGENVTVFGLVRPPRKLDLTLVFKGPDGKDIKKPLSCTQEGNFNYTTLFQQEGEHEVFVEYAGSQTINPTRSEILKITVIRILNVTISISSPKEEYNPGEDLIVIGLVDPPNILDLTLIYKKPDGSEVARKVRSYPNGTFNDKITADQEGKYEVIAKWAGDELIKAAESKKLMVNVARRIGGYTWSDLVNLIVSLFPVTIIIGAGLLSAAFLYIGSRTRAKQPEMEMPASVRERDEGLVISLLKSRGGVLPQSEIKKLTGFSKAKTSFVLKSLQEKGQIRKEKWGREFIVHLTENGELT